MSVEQFCPYKPTKPLLIAMAEEQRDFEEQRAENESSLEKFDRLVAESQIHWATTTPITMADNGFQVQYSEIIASPLTCLSNNLIVPIQDMSAATLETPTSGLRS